MTTLSDQEQIQVYRGLVVCRHLEESLTEHDPSHHGAIGEEATHLGAFFGLRKDDVVAPHYRGCLGAMYLRFPSVVDIFKLVSGNGETGGRCGIGSFEHRILPFLTSVLATNFPLATGAALAMKVKKQDSVAVMLFGDGESSRGEFHEALNLASVLKLPVVYVCVNNGWSSLVPAEKGVAVKDIADRASGYNIPGVVVDGNDVLAVHEAVQKAVARARKGDGPSLIECKTYRMDGLFTLDKDLYLTKEHKAIQEGFRKRDPVKLFREVLIKKGLLTEQEAEAYSQQAIAEIEKAAKEASENPRSGLDREWTRSGVYAP
jgi:TPP-dependent pyruvate/acetoin dehydrogenase alpha subunit